MDTDSFVCSRLRQQQKLPPTSQRKRKTTSQFEIDKTKGTIHRCCESLQIGVPLVLSRERSIRRLWGTSLVDTWGTQNETKYDPQQDICTSPAGSYSNHGPRIRGTLRVGYITTSGAPISCRRHPEATHAFFFCEFKIASSNTKTTEIVETYKFTHGRLIQWVHRRRKKTAFTKRLLLTRRMI